MYRNTLIINDLQLQCVVDSHTCRAFCGGATGRFAVCSFSEDNLMLNLMSVEI